jgi:2-phosphoglycerate kinase
VTEPRRRDPLPLGGEHGLPYSRGLMARALVAVGVSADRAYELATRVDADLRATGGDIAELERIELLATEVLGADDAAVAMRRLRRYQELRALDLPIIVLVGGATGTGKSTVATEVAHRLGITRVASTDFVRQTMRAFFSREFMPSVHYSSFEAGDALPEAEREEGDPLVLGFLDQTRHVLVGVDAAIKRVLQEGWSMVLEGVHLVPGMLQPIEGALVVQCVLAIKDEDVHASHFFTRDASSGGVRPVSKYVDRLGSIRRIQKYIVEQAGRTGVPVVENDNMEDATAAVMELVIEGAERLQAAAVR